MEKDQLKLRIDELMTELHNYKKLDESTRESLVSLAQEIRDNIGSTHSELDSTHQKNLEDYFLEFKEQHPQLSSVLEQIIQALSSAGV